MQLSDKIAYLRKKHSMSQEQLADKLDISRQAIYKWEAGISIPELEKIKRLAEIFEVSFDDLLNDERPRFNINIPKPTTSIKNVPCSPLQKTSNKRKGMLYIKRNRTKKSTLACKASSKREHTKIEYNNYNVFWHSLSPKRLASIVSIKALLKKSRHTTYSKNTSRYTLSRIEIKKRMMHRLASSLKLTNYKAESL